MLAYSLIHDKFIKAKLNHLFHVILEPKSNSRLFAKFAYNHIISHNM